MVEGVGRAGLDCGLIAMCVCPCCGVLSATHPPTSVSHAPTHPPTHPPKIVSHAPTHPPAHQCVTCIKGVVDHHGPAMHVGPQVGQVRVHPIHDGR